MVYISYYQTNRYGQISGSWVASVEPSGGGVSDLVPVTESRIYHSSQAQKLDETEHDFVTAPKLIIKSIKRLLMSTTMLLP